MSSSTVFSAVTQSVSSLGQQAAQLSHAIDATPVGRHLLAAGDTGQDLVQLARGGSRTAMQHQHLFNRLVAAAPRPVQRGVGAIVSAIDNIPGTQGMSATMKFGLAKLLFAITAFEAIRDGVRTWQNAPSHKWGAAAGEVGRSVMKNAIIFAATLVTATLTPALLGLSSLGSLGILASMATSFLVGHQVKGLLDKHHAKHPMYATYHRTKTGHSPAVAGKLKQPPSVARRGGKARPFITGSFITSPFIKGTKANPFIK
ncbi:MAG: hypothetical protein KC475_11165 [Cyanobacteria bacterium HKST-UBA03]|nr:hypothetical protein [Cyanobacteria bacterium HKST-UBA03]